MARGRRYEATIPMLNALRSSHASARGESAYSETIYALRVVLKGLDCHDGIGAIAAVFWFIFRVSGSFLEATACSAAVAADSQRQDMENRGQRNEMR
ncbi:hypothetical protein ASPCAL05225 [Aspergillus calidoustus]|uniref:Uncharacterized protein n=1 Tax=Aspergillus calidoustus TaxID=454130 RepID=A0A0U5FZK3_ASPCI|nr:hypothetical protein ASPCAL05225 [Aspergillus calidoustus]